MHPRLTRRELLKNAALSSAGLLAATRSARSLKTLVAPAGLAVFEVAVGEDILGGPEGQDTGA